VIVLPSSIRDAIVDRARESAPEESCGVLGGSYEPIGQSVVRSQYPAENVADRPRTRYRIDPEDQLAIFESIEARGEAIVGFYHSHPRGPPEPSATDNAQATWPDRSYVIVSLDPLAVGSWRWRTATDNHEETGAFEREPIEIES